MKSFVEFVESEIGRSPEAIAQALSYKISNIASGCRIDWESSKTKISFDGTRQYSPNVKGLTDKDFGRVYIWVNVNRHTQRDGKYIDYPIIVFKSYQATYGEPTESFNTLSELFDLYKDYRTNGVFTKSVCKVDENEIKKQRELVSIEQANKKIKVGKHIKKEKLRFLKLPSLGSNKSLFSPYTNQKKTTLAAKKLQEIKVGSDKYGYFTCFPLYNIKGDFQGLQRIYHIKPESWDDNKKFSWGLNPVGSMFVIGSLKDSEMCYIVEGLCTGLSMRMATGKTVVIALNANNIESVSGNISKKYPNCKRVHVADNDNTKVHHGNTGVFKCSKAVKNHGGFVFVPRPSKGVDANDVHVFDGLAVLKAQIKDVSNYFNGRLSVNVGAIFNWL